MLFETKNPMVLVKITWREYVKRIEFKSENRVVSRSFARHSLRCMYRWYIM